MPTDVTRQRTPTIAAGLTNMKALVISDIHSNIYALEAIWAQERDSDVIYLDQAAHYLTITDGTILLRQVQYDLAPLYRSVLALNVKEAERRTALHFFGLRDTL